MVRCFGRIEARPILLVQPSPPFRPLKVTISLEAAERKPGADAILVEHRKHPRKCLGYLHGPQTVDGSGNARPIVCGSASSAPGNETLMLPRFGNNRRISFARSSLRNPELSSVLNSSDSGIIELGIPLERSIHLLSLQRHRCVSRFADRDNGEASNSEGFKANIFDRPRAIFGAQ